MNINATLINILQICQRELWLHANNITMEHTSDLVTEGKQIGEESYPQRAERNQEVAISAEINGIACNAKIDFYDAKSGVVHEIKKSSAKEMAHVSQVQFYLYLLRKNGIEANYGIIEYPKLRQTEKVELHEDDIQKIERWVKKVDEIINQEMCPPSLPKSKCRNCSYFDFCHTVEE
ncbi:CRISPR-associated exonuclease, Cas4 family [Pseudarcicella hirudinis]|uniref:CRISPR-associated exonuclease Cas4 n=1 Tax=Pseudarcicella hirudinis TaxID=1079859 RepID=A0A1I5VKH8_9BACT|nr:CRISPR-associated protein Cas4 [Pseudarcicella hirudinis]SFQ08068.1 CRISPR-associated exonuclease, Cas4 family [Pseudarcicella hirudinis]